MMQNIKVLIACIIDNILGEQLDMLQMKFCLILMIS